MKNFCKGNFAIFFLKYVDFDSKNGGICRTLSKSDKVLNSAWSVLDRS